MSTADPAIGLWPDVEPPAQPSIRLAQPDVGTPELEAIREVLESGILTNGPRVEAFERAFAERHGCSYGVAFANGTVALTALLAALEIGPGDEVVVPSMTFISTATAVLHVGATPVFADVERETFNLDPEDVSGRITSRTRAIIAVHYGGQTGDMDSLATLAADSGLILLEDAAEAHGASYRGRPVGSIGRAGMFSFTPTKNITTGEGGMAVTNDGVLAQRLNLLRNHGQSSTYVHASLGYNWRLTEMQAAMGLVQLTKLDEILERKRRIADQLTGLLSTLEGIQAPYTAADRDHVFMLYTTLVEHDRDKVMQHLTEAGIETRLYFPPAHRQPVFAGFEADLPVTDWAAARMLSLPCHSLLRPADLERIAGVVREALGS